MNGSEEQILPDRVGNERCAILLRQFVVFAMYVARLTRRPGIGHSLMPSFSTIKRCRPTNPISIPGMTKTCSAKNRESVAPAMIGPTEHQLHDRGTDDRHAARDRCADSESPIRVLIETQHLPGEGHAECHQQKKDTDDPGELARKLVGSKEKHLHHVNEDNRHHEV